MERRKREKLLKIIVPSSIFLCILFLCLLISKELVYVIKHIISGETDELKEYMDNLGYEGVLVLIFLQALQTLTTVLPGEPVQIIAGLAYGKWLGTAIGISGILLGGLVLFVLVKRFDKEIIRIFTPKKRQAKEEELEAKLKTSNRSLIFVILILYFLPAIPYGFICIVAATLGMKIYNFIWVTAVGTLPSVLSCVVIGNQIVKSNYWVSLGVFLFLVIVMIVVIKKKDYIMEKIMYKKYQNHLDKLKKYPIKAPNKTLVEFVKLIGRTHYKKKLNFNIQYDFDIDSLKEPFVVINNHGSMYDFVYANLALKKRRMNNLMAYDYFLKKRVGNLLLKAGCIPKFLFCPDFTATKRMLKTVKEGRIIGIAPEGRLSPSGSMETVNETTVKLLKKLGIPVVNVHISGGYLTKPKWSKKIRRGRVDVRVSMMFDVEDIKTLNENEIYERLKSAVDYNDFEWQKQNRVRFNSKEIAEGLDGILYLCPECKEVFKLESGRDYIECKNCGMKIKMNNYYDFSSENCSAMPENIDVWYKLQKEYEYNNCKKEGFDLHAYVTLKMPDENGRGLTETDRGEAVLNKNGLSFKGKKGTELFFDIKNIEALPFACKKDFELYSDENYYYFAPENPVESVRFSVVAEQFYKLYSEEKASEEKEIQ